MNPQKIKLDLRSIAGDDNLILTEVRPLYEYEDGKRTDKRIGTTYCTVSKHLGYETVNVKVLEKKETISQKEIDGSKYEIHVTFQGFQAKFYRDNRGEYALTASADSVSIEEAELEMG